MTSPPTDYPQTLECALGTWGSDAQILMFIEESAEATEAILHHRRGKTDVDHVIEELADLQIMLHQMRMLYDHDQKFLEIYNRKLARLRDMLSECSICGEPLGEEPPQMNGMCIDCLADKWGEIVEESPMVSPQTLHKERANHSL